MKLSIFSLLILLISAVFNPALANSSFSGLYAGSTEDQYTQIAFRLTPRNRIARLRIISLTAACVTEIPGQDPVTSERSTNITRDETPIVNLNGQGRYNQEFQLLDPARVDFQGATVTIRGRVRGGTGRMVVDLTHSQTYDEDSSTETCAGTAIVRVRYYPR